MKLIYCSQKVEDQGQGVSCRATRAQRRKNFGLLLLVMTRVLRLALLLRGKKRKQEREVCLSSRASIVEGFYL